LQAGYFILAARAVGLDCGPMSGFNNAGVDGEFFADTHFKSNLLCNIGHGAEGSPRPRAPRLDFDEACRIL
jgi:3-hydroxypropanoate dehydrogenase